MLGTKKGEHQNLREQIDVGEKVIDVELWDGCQKRWDWKKEESQKRRGAEGTRNGMRGERDVRALWLCHNVFTSRGCNKVTTNQDVAQQRLHGLNKMRSTLRATWGVSWGWENWFVFLHKLICVGDVAKSCVAARYVWFLWIKVRTHRARNIKSSGEVYVKFYKLSMDLWCEVKLTSTNLTKSNSLRKRVAISCKHRTHWVRTWFGRTGSSSFWWHWTCELSLGRMSARHNNDCDVLIIKLSLNIK